MLTHLMAHRIASLLSSGTEIVCALGFEKELVARSHECDFPDSILSLPVATETKFDPDGTSYEIDQRVKAILQEGLSVYRVKGELLRNLEPDVIITQIQCEVCAVSRKDVEEAVYSWMAETPSKVRPTIVSLNPNALADIWEDIRAVARALEAHDRGEALVASLKSRMEEVAAEARKRVAKEKTGNTTGQREARPTVACIEWIEPLMAAGNWVPELVELAGGRNLFGEAGKHSPWMTWDALRASDPDVILVLPCGWGIERSLREMPTLERLPGWATLKAVRSKHIYLADGNRYFNRPGPRIVESLEILAEILGHATEQAPGQATVPPKHQGSGWRVY